MPIVLEVALPDTSPAAEPEYSAFATKRSVDIASEALAAGSPHWLSTIALTSVNANSRRFIIPPLIVMVTKA